jgi:signal transduction histidine kinase
MGDPDEAVREAVSQNQFIDYRIVVYTEARREVAASAAPRKRNKPDLPRQPAASQLTGVLDAVDHTPNSALYFATLSDGDNDYRVVARRVLAGGSPYTLVVLRSLHDQEDLLEGASYALFIAVPLALLLASIGGYFLVRTSLAPVVRMSATAARIGAANLHERLPVANERDELGALARVINALLARLDISFEQQRRFMADASHELRTPIAIMRSEAEVALAEPETSNRAMRESISIFRDETKRLTGIVEDLFTLARADAGQYKLTPKEVYLDEVEFSAARATTEAIQSGGCRGRTLEGPRAHHS